MAAPPQPTPASHDAPDGASVSAPAARAIAPGRPLPGDQRRDAESGPTFAARSPASQTVVRPSTATSTP